MKLFKPDTQSTEKWESESFDFKCEFRENFTMRELNTAMSLADSPAYDQNKYVVSVLLVNVLTKPTDDKGKAIEVSRDESLTQGVQLIKDDFIDMLPPSLFVEMANFCMTKAVTKLTDDTAKN